MISRNTSRAGFCDSLAGECWCTVAPSTSKHRFDIHGGDCLAIPGTSLPNGSLGGFCWWSLYFNSPIDDHGSRDPYCTWDPVKCRVLLGRLGGAVTRYVCNPRFGRTKKGSS